jgi:hypothetical protein
MRITRPALASLLLLIFGARCTFAEISPATGNPLNGKLSFISSNFAAPPTGRELKHKPSAVRIYEYDRKPLGNRSPFLLVHGLRGEYWSDFRWTKVIKKFTSDEQFDSQYKVYLVRYDSTAPLEKTVPEFRDALSNLYQFADQRQVTAMALSLGGNLVYEGMLDPKTNDRIKLVLTMGTPFRGSPLFSANWVKYSMYKNLCFPWTRVDHSIAYDLYFAKNRNLQQDLGWDDVDKTVPEIGKFASLLPLGPKGDLTVADTTNERLLNLERENFNKKKLIAYGSYLLNPYMLPDSARFVETTVMAPYTMIFMKVPAHLAREHPVLKLLNKQISSTVPSAVAAEQARTKFVYQLNDGITPVTSALFLPSQVCNEVRRESDLAKVKDAVDVRLARVFRNADHLTFIDGYRPIHAPVAIRDELNPSERPKQIFDWMLTDIMNATSNQNTLAKETNAAQSRED